MSEIESMIVAQLQNILDLWKVTYNVEDEKYVAKTNSLVILNSDQIEWIGHMGLSVFSIQRYEDTLTVRFSSGGGCCN